MRKIIVSIIVIVMITSMMVGCGNRVEIPEGEPIITEEYSTESPTEPKTVMGTVNTDRLNVREEPDTNCTVIRQLEVGTRVEILEQKILDAVPWGRIEDGWINLRYVDLDGE